MLTTRGHRPNRLEAVAIFFSASLHDRLYVYVCKRRNEVKFSSRVYTLDRKFRNIFCRKIKKRTREEEYRSIRRICEFYWEGKKRNDLKFTKKDLETFEREIRTYTYTYKRREHKYEHRYRQETRYTRNI